MANWYVPSKKSVGAAAEHHEQRAEAAAEDQNEIEINKSNLKVLWAINYLGSCKNVERMENKAWVSEIFILLVEYLQREVLQFD